MAGPLRVTQYLVRWMEAGMHEKGSSAAALNPCMRRVKRGQCPKPGGPECESTGPSVC